MAKAPGKAYPLTIDDWRGKVFRNLYKCTDSIHVLQAFQKKTQKTAKADLELPRRRYKLIPGAKP